MFTVSNKTFLASLFNVDLHQLRIGVDFDWKVAMNPAQQRRRRKEKQKRSWGREGEVARRVGHH